MSYKQRRFTCEGCGRETVRTLHSIDARICLDCGLDRAAQAAREMAAKSGPAWEAFKKNPGAYARRRT